MKISQYTVWQNANVHIIIEHVHVIQSNLSTGGWASIICSVKLVFLNLNV